MTTIKATRATITLGDIELDVFQKPDGTYFMSSSNIAKTLDMTEKSFLPKYVSKDLKAILEASPRFVVFGQKLSIEDNNVQVNTIPLELVSLIFGHYASKGNVKASALLMASLTEALERRADTAFNVQRTEDERNAKLAQRAKNIMIRRTLTDAIRDYTIKHESSETYIKFIYSNCSEHLNKIILGAKAKQAKEFYALPAHSLLRNHIPVKALRELELVEEMASRLIDERDVEPLEAVKQACTICFTKTIGLE